MNWISEAHKSWEWLQWMREVLVDADDMERGECLPALIRGMSEWDEAIARDRHSVGDPGRVDRREHFLFAASMMSRAAKAAIEDALKAAIEWKVDDPMAWSSLDLPEAKRHWAASHHVVKVVLQAWIVLWNDLAEFQGQLSAPTFAEQLEQWRELADQAEQVVSGAAVAAWAQSDMAGAR
jgi:hypothetical protein